MQRKQRINLLQDDSDFEEVDMQEMKVCYVGQLKHKFILKVDIELDDVIEVKSEILERLGLSTPDDGYGTGINSTNPWMKKIKLFSLKGGLELSNRDRMESLQGQKYLYYSFGEPFDHQVRMEFIDIERKLGEGGFGSVYLGYDKLLSQQVAIKLLNFGSSIKNSNMITKEIDALGQLRHKNIVKLLDYFPLPKKQQLIVVMEYLKGGELDVLWKAQPMRRFSERNAYSLFIQLMTAIDYCHNSKIIHRDMKFQNVMLAEVPKYEKNGKLDVSSINLKVVDFGIFGSISGNRLENINFGSLRFMAPELLQGDIKSTTKIDIWSLGLMLHAMVFGFLPFNANERNALEQQILNDEIEYGTIKKLKTSSIKNEVRRALNIMLKTTSDELIDLIEKMLKKDPEQRIDNLSIFEHPWIMKYRYDPFDDSNESEEEHDQKEVSAKVADKNGMNETNSDFFGEEKMQETNVDSDPVQLDNKSSRGTSSPNSFMNSELEKGKVGKNGINQILKNHFMFNIEEHDNETTGNFVKVDLKQKKPMQVQESTCVPEEEVFSKGQRIGYKKKNSKLSVIRHVSLKKTNVNLNEENRDRDLQRGLKRSNLLMMDDKRKSSAINSSQQDVVGNGDADSNQPNQSSQNRKQEELSQPQCPFSLVQTNSAQDGVNLNSQRSKTIKKKRKVMKKTNNQATDGDYDADTNYNHQKIAKLTKKQQKQYLSNYGGGNDHGMLDKKISSNYDFAMENCYIIEGPREGVEAQNIRLNVAMEKSSKMNNNGNRVQIHKIKSSQRVMQAQQYRQDNHHQSTIEKVKQSQKRDFLPILSKLQTNYDNVMQDQQSTPPLLLDKKTPNGQSKTAVYFGSSLSPFKDSYLRNNCATGSIGNGPISSVAAGNQINRSQYEQLQQSSKRKDSNLTDVIQQQAGVDNENSVSISMQVGNILQHSSGKNQNLNIANVLPLQNSRNDSPIGNLNEIKYQPLTAAEDESSDQKMYAESAQKTQKKPIIKISRAQIQSYSCDKQSNTQNSDSKVLQVNNHSRSDIGNHLVVLNKNQPDCSFLHLPNSNGIGGIEHFQLRSQQSSSPRQERSSNQNLNVVINNKELIIGAESPLRLKRKNFDLIDQGLQTVKGQQPILQSFDKINVKQLDAFKSSKQGSFMSNQRAFEQVNPTSYFSNNPKTGYQPNSLVNLPSNSGNYSNPNQFHGKSLPRRDIQFYKGNQFKQQLQFNESDMHQLNENQLIKKYQDHPDDRNQPTRLNDHLEQASTASGIALQNQRQQLMSKHQENNVQIAPDQIYCQNQKNLINQIGQIASNKSDCISVNSNKSNDGLEALNPSRLQNFNAKQNAQSPLNHQQAGNIYQQAALSLTQQTTENSIGGGNYLRINGMQHTISKRASSGMPVVLKNENSPGLVMHSDTYKKVSNTTGFKYIQPLSRQSDEQVNPREGDEVKMATQFEPQPPSIGQNYQQHLERSRTQDGATNQLIGNGSHGPKGTRYQFQSNNLCLPQMKDRGEKCFVDQTMIITPIKKMSDQIQHFAIISSKSSKKNTNQNSTTTEIMLKQYQTIENSNGGKSSMHHHHQLQVPLIHSTGFKNHTQTNFNTGGIAQVARVPGTTASASTTGNQKFTFNDSQHRPNQQKNNKILIQETDVISPRIQSLKPNGQSKPPINSLKPQAVNLADNSSKKVPTTMTTGPEILLGQSVCLTNHNERHSRGTAGSNARRQDQRRVFQIKGQGLQPVQSSVSGATSNVLESASMAQPQARLTQSDMKRTRNLTQNDMQIYEKSKMFQKCQNGQN